MEVQWCSKYGAGAVAECRLRYAGNMVVLYSHTSKTTFQKLFSVIANIDAAFLLCIGFLFRSATYFLFILKYVVKMCFFFSIISNENRGEAI